MSVLFSYKNCYLISHEKFINQIYSNVAHSDEKRTVSVRILSAIFDLNSQYRNQKNKNESRQRKVVYKKKLKEINDNQEEHQLVSIKKNKIHSSTNHSIYFILIFNERFNELKQKQRIS